MTPIIAITMGDATGIGPEVIVKALSHPEGYKECRPVVIGDTKRLQQAQRITKSRVEINTIAPEAITHSHCQPGIVDCIDLALIPQDLPWGRSLRSLATLRFNT